MAAHREVGRAGREDHLPKWIESGSVTIKLTEFNPEATEAIIESLREVLPGDDDRVKLLMQLWDALTGDE